MSRPIDSNIPPPASPAKRPVIGYRRLPPGRGHSSDFDNPNVRLYVPCGYCHRPVKHTSYHPACSTGLVCAWCASYLSSPAYYTPSRLSAPSRHLGRIIDSDVPIPPED